MTQIMDTESDPTTTFGYATPATDRQRDYFCSRIDSIAYNNDDNLEMVEEELMPPWSKLREEVQKAVDRCRDDIMASDNARYMKAVVEEFAKGDYA